MSLTWHLHLLQAALLPVKQRAHQKFSAYNNIPLALTCSQLWRHNNITLTHPPRQTIAMWRACLNRDTARAVAVVHICIQPGPNMVQCWVACLSSFATMQHNQRSWSERETCRADPLHTTLWQAHATGWASPHKRRQVYLHTLMCITHEVLRSAVQYDVASDSPPYAALNSLQNQYCMPRSIEPSSRPACSC